MSCPFDVTTMSRDNQLLGGAVSLIAVGLAIGLCQSCFLISAVSLIAGGGTLGYWVSMRQARWKRVNGKIQLTSDKIVHSVDIEDIGDKKVYCRCWKSEKFPLCDGSHNAHNKETGDNIGPLIVEKKQ